MPRYLRLFVLALLTLTSFGLGCSDQGQETPLDTWERPTPSVPADGQWQQVEGPPYSKTLPSDPPAFLGTLDETLYLTQKRGHSHRIIAVDSRSGDWQVAEALEDVPAEIDQPLGIGRWGDVAYFWGDESMFRLAEDRGQWHEAAQNFEQIFEIDGVVFAQTNRLSEQMPDSLLRKEPGGEWEQIYDEVDRVAQTGDLIHIKRSGTHLYSDDGGLNWQEHDDYSHVFRPPGQITPAVYHDGRYWTDDAISGKARVSDDGLNWRQEDVEGLEGSLRDLVVHDGQLYGIERSERIVYSGGEDHIVHWTGQRWQRLERPAHTRLIGLTSDAEALYAETRSAGFWRSTDGASTWEPIGPPLATPTGLAASSSGLCTLGGVFGVLSCRSDDRSSWWREGLGPLREVERVFDNGDQLYFAVEVHHEDLSRGSMGTELWRLASDDSVEMVAGADAISSSAIVDAAFEYDGRTHVMLRTGEVLRIGEDRISTDEVVTLEGPHSESDPSDAIVMHGAIWLISRDYDGWVHRVDHDSQIEPRVDGLAERNAELDDRDPLPVSFARTQQDLYVLVRRARLNSDGEGMHWLGHVYAWSESGQRWIETPMPSREELGGEAFKWLQGSSDAVYAATRSSVYQYDPSQNQWKDLSRGLPSYRKLSALAVSGDQLNVSVVDHGIFEYVFDTPVE